MTPTIVSKFRQSFIAKLIVGAFMIGFWLYYVYRRYIMYGSPADKSGATIFLAVAGLVGIGFFVNYVSRTVVKITAGPDQLEFYYYLTSKRIVISYDDITHVYNDLVPGDPDKPETYASYLELFIDLKSGKTLTFSEKQFDNYFELKESIRRHRFHLD